MSYSKVQEALDLLQEEAAEVIQQVSKVRRFGDDFRCHGGRDDDCKQLLHNEIFDMRVILEFLEDQDYFSWDGYEAHKAAKIERLKVWSTLYRD